MGLFSGQDPELKSVETVNKLGFFTHICFKFLQVTQDCDKTVLGVIIKEGGNYYRNYGIDMRLCLLMES